MNRKKYIILGILSLIMIVFSLIFYTTFYTSHRDIASEKPQVLIEASELQLQYVKDYTKANKEYADKVIETIGTVTAAEEHTVILNNIVQVDFLKEITGELVLGQSLTIKGRCVGYDDLLEVVKLDQAIVITNK